MPPLIEDLSGSESSSSKRSYRTAFESSPAPCAKRLRTESPPTSRERGELNSYKGADNSNPSADENFDLTIRERPVLKQTLDQPQREQNLRSIPARTSRSVVINIPPPRHPASSCLPTSQRELHHAFDQIRIESGADRITNRNAYKTVRLSDFSIYRRTKAGDVEFVTLDAAGSTKTGHDTLFFDGAAQTAGSSTNHDLRAVPFQIVSVEGYDAQSHDAMTFWIQSTLDRRIWFTLSSPSPQYQHYWTPFIWVTRFTKYFIEFCADEDVADVTLPALKHDLTEFLRRRYSSNAVFERWLSKHPAGDFRQHFARHANFIWKEVSSVLPIARTFSIWKDVAFGDFSAIPQQHMEDNDVTMVTPSIYNFFKRTYFGEVLRPIRMSAEVMTARDRHLKSLGFPRAYAESLSDFALRPQPRNPTIKVSVGDVVGMPPDSQAPDSAWRKCTANLWWAYVQGIRRSQSGTKLEVLWLYRPEHTILGNGYYPFANEFFLGEHCNCGEVASLDESHITHTLDVVWAPKTIPTDRAFIRFQYTNNEAICTLDKNDQRVFQCEHKHRKPGVWSQVLSKYKVGDAILAKVSDRESETLEPFVISAFEERSGVVQARALLRADREFSEQGPANELIWTDVIVNLRPKHIQRKCYIRFSPRGSTPPTPYDRNGQVDCFYIATRLEPGPVPRYHDLQEPFPSGMTQGPLPDARKALYGLSLFSGGGNFDFGLQDSGAVNITHHVEWDRLAAHTLRANEGDTSSNIWMGSIDDYIRVLASGKSHSLIATIGNIAFISAGSPCQGFSMMQKNKTSQQSLINASKVASVAAFIDVYRPKYALLENVPEMATKNKDTGISVLDQLLCALVAMGYQVKVFNIVAYSMGEPQMRARLFVSVTAPGLRQPDYPPITHHDASIDCRKLNRALGETMNGLKFGLPEIDLDDAAPFKVVTAAKATQDLPDIGDGHLGICIPYPDHRVPVTISARDQLIIESIPRFPREQGLRDLVVFNAETQAYEGNPDLGLPQTILTYIAKAHVFRLRKQSKSFMRINPDRSFKTITTHQTPTDANTGQTLHWDQHRPLTIMEARRAQGFLDSQVVLGGPSKQWKIIGNSVARGVGLALGMSLGRAMRGETL